MSLMNSDICDGVLLEQDCITIPLFQFENLIRAETERNILEAALSGDKKYCADEVAAAIQAARKCPSRCNQAVCCSSPLSPLCPCEKVAVNEDSAVPEIMDDCCDNEDAPC